MVEYKNQLMQFFSFSHLPEYLAKVSKPFYELACHLDETLPDNIEKTAAFRELLKAKDCAVRSAIFKPTE